MAVSTDVMVTSPTTTVKLIFPLHLHLPMIWCAHKVSKVMIVVGEIEHSHSRWSYTLLLFLDLVSNVNENSCFCLAPVLKGFYT